MKRKTIKILIIALVVILLSFSSGCNFGGLLGYMTGNFPSSDIGGGDQNTPNTPSTPNIADSDVYINKGNATTQTGGLADVVEEVAPSVVEISASYAYTYVIDGSDYAKESRGSGIILKKDDESIYIVTNQHVVQDGYDLTNNYGRPLYKFVSMNITVRLTSGMEYKATKVFDDESGDIALLKISRSEFTSYELYLDVKVAGIQSVYSVSEGERVFAIGNPLGTLGGTVTAGIISATEREIQVDKNVKMSLIQMDAAVNEGNSGGALFNYEGKLVGVVNAKISRTGVEGLGFAIPISTALEIIHGAGHLTDITFEEVNQ